MGLFDSIKEAFQTDQQKLADWAKELADLQAKLPNASGKEAADIQKEIDDLNIKIEGTKSKLGINDEAPAAASPSDGPMANADIVPDPMATPIPETSQAEADARAAEAKAAEEAAAAKAAEEAAAAKAAEEAAAAKAAEEAAAAKAAQEAAALAAQQRTYTVKPGDTLSKIGRHFGVNYMDIVKLNGIENPDLIYPGQVFKIPS